MLLSHLITSQHLSVLCLVETWLFESDLPTFLANLPSNYSFFHKARSNSKSSGGGVGCLYNKSHPLSMLPDPIPCPSSFEFLSLCLSAPGCPKFCVLIIYRHNHPRTTSSFFSEFPLLIEAITSAFSSRFIVLGDFNFRVDAPLTCSYSAKFLSLLESQGLLSPITAPTHISGHTLDLILYPAPVLSSDYSPPDIHVFPPDPSFSDHSLILSPLPVPKILEPSSSTCYRNYKNFDPLLFHSLLSQLLPIDFFRSLSPPYIFAFFSRVLSSVNDIVFPPAFRRQTHRHSPWETNHLIRLKRHQRYLERVWRRSALSADWTAYCAARSSYLALVSSSKQKYFSSRLSTLRNSPKALWSTLNSLTGLRSPSSVSSLSADDLANYFIGKIASAHSACDPCELPLLHTNSSITFSSFSQINIHDILTLLSTSKLSSSPIDPINFKAISLAVDSLVPYLLYLINSSFLHGVFLADKHAVILPVLKKPTLDPNIPSNFRPISHLSFPSKLLESAIFSQLSPLINSVLDPFQSGFRASHSTESVLIDVSQNILSHFSYRHSVLLVLLDMSSAFDLVNHNILLDDLSHIGVCDSALSLLRSYLLNRTYSVMFNSTQSSTHPLASGVPQGSILGPMLFNLYLSSLGNIIRRYNIPFHIYADDIQLIVPCPSSDSIIVTPILSDIQSWISSRHLRLNSSKSEYLVLHPPRISPPVLPFPLSDTVKNLGIIFDSSLTFSCNVVSVVRTCRLILRSLYPIRPFLDQPSAIKLIQSFVFSRLDYCNCLYYSLPKSSLILLQRVINQSCRFVLHPIPCRHTSSFLYEFRWLPIRPRVHLRTCCLIFKLLHDKKQPSYLATILAPSNNISSRNPQPLSCPRALNESPWSSKSLYFFGPRLYNSLPSHITSLSSYKSFRDSLHNFLFEKSFDPLSHSLTPFASI